MLATIIVGYDGSETADDALALAAGLAEAGSGRLLVVYVYDGRFADSTPGTAEAMAANADAILDRARAQLDPDLRSELAAASEGSPAAILHALAESERADLIVVGSRRLGPLARITAGSVSGPVLHGAPCPVAIPPVGHRLDPRPPARQIVVGWVPTSDGDAALRFACEIAAATGGELHLMSSVSAGTIALVAGAAAFTDALLGDLEVGVGRDAEAAVARLAGELPVAIEIRRGDAAAELIARSHDVDLIVLGSRGYGPLRRVLVGGVGTKVIAEAHCPVLVVPRSAGTA